MTTTEAQTRQPSERANARPLPRRVGLCRARRREALLRGLRLGGADRLPPADVVDHPLAPLEDADPHLARHCRVLTFDGRGNGRSDRPESGYSEHEFAADALAVMDATETEQAALVSLSLGAQRALLLAAEQPERVDAAVFICPSVPLAERPEARAIAERWGEELDTDEGWAKYNRHYWLKDYKGFLEFFFSQMFNEPHSTKPIEDAVGWGLETTGETLIATKLDGELDADSHARAGRPPALPGAGDPGIAGRDHRSRPRRRARGGDRRRPRHARGLGPRPARARPGQGQSAPARVPRPRAPAARAGCAASRAASARSTSPRRSGSGTRSATWRSRRSCGSCTPTSRSTGSPSTPSRACWRPAARPSIRRARTWRTSPATSRASRPSTTCTASRRSGGWTRSCSPTTWSSTTSSARSSTTSGSATRRGSSTTTCTRTPSRSGPPTCGSPTSSAGCRWTTAASMSRSSPPTTTRR